MKLNRVGNSGLKASIIGFGTWLAGAWYWKRIELHSFIKVIHAGIDHGVNLIDTAPVYGLGQAETYVGKAIARKREKIILSTKCGLIWNQQAGHFFFNQSNHSIYRYLGKTSIYNELETSLKRLNTDYIDIYFVHWMDQITPIDEVIGTLLDLKRRGKIRAIGISNANLLHYQDYFKSQNLDVGQELYNLLNRDLEEEILPFCQKNKLALFAYSPFAQGLLTGKIMQELPFRDRDLRKYNPAFSQENISIINALLNKLKVISKLNRLSLSQLIIAWILSQPGISHVLCSAIDVNYAIENAKAGSMTLSQETNDLINKVIEECSLRFNLLEELPY